MAAIETNYYVNNEVNGVTLYNVTTDLRPIAAP